MVCNSEKFKAIYAFVRVSMFSWCCERGRVHPQKYGVWVLMHQHCRCWHFRGWRNLVICKTMNILYTPRHRLPSECKQKWQECVLDLFNPFKNVPKHLHIVLSSDNLSIVYIRRTPQCWMCIHIHRVKYLPNLARPIKIQHLEFSWIAIFPDHQIGIA